MGLLNTVAYKLRYGDDFASGVTTPVKMINRGGGFTPDLQQMMLAYGDTVPADTTIGYSKGCIFQKFDGTLGTLLYINTGSYTSSAFVAIDALIGAGNLTIATAKTLAVTDADALTVGALKVPQHVWMNMPITLHASKVYYHIHTFRHAMKLVDGDWVGDVAQAITGTIVKASSTTAPSASTTPCTTADQINLNTTASTIQNIIASFTVTVADRTFAVGDRCAFVTNAALTSGSGMLSLKFQYV